ncbi:RNA polymerase II degradation factor 1-like isoform X3 [Salvia splendens]|uniref:RNA polymerase II degradation factor 1-like isoform X3 n=1 Tax=Salvia splendens TaxID=180675 RepID=UPI001C251437|nr:RNA polymerase II degradation factor 1-like isoform X3 [Salvia splendens]
MEVPPLAPTAARNGGFAMPSSSSQPSRKEWAAVSEQSVRNSANEELGRSKQVHSDERLTYEQRLHELAKQREELQLMEIELRAQNIARSEIARIHSNFDAQITEHGNANVKLQEQLHEKEENIRELERKIEEKDRELHAIRLDNEAAWAKQDLLREQNKELQSYRRERDSSEAERVQHISQIHELQEHIQEKDRQFMELQEQHRIAQETLNFKEEQLRDAQAWMTRAHELDALNSSTNHNLQAELRDRTDHYNQLWLACQRQCGEMERLHLHIQQLQLELVDAREKTGSNMDGSNISQIDASKLEQSNDGQQDVNIRGSQGTNIGSIQNGNIVCVSDGNTSTQADNVKVVAFAPSSLLGMPPYAQPGQVTALHPFVMHQQGVPHPSHVMQSHFHSVSTMPSDQNSQQGQPEGQHVPIPNQYDQETEQNLVKTHSNIGYKASGNGQIFHVTNLETNISQGLDADSIPSANEDSKVLDSTGKSYDKTQSPESLQKVSSHFRNALSLDHLENENDTKPQEKQVNPVHDHGTENKSTMENLNLAGLVLSERDASVKNFSEKITNNGSSTDKAGASVSAGQKSITGNTAESFLLDERVLLASIVRTIGSGGRIRISSTLPNRLGKMLAPLHWYDYKRKYGKLDDFIAGHPELFLIEGDYIQLREGAQETIAASAAVARVAAAAAAAPLSNSSLLPSVAVTPMAQSHRLKKASPHDSSYVNVNKSSFNELGAPRPLNANEHPSQFSAAQSRNINGGSLRVPGGSHGRPGMSSAGKQQRAVGAVPNVRR